jgi:hypothetical protein
MAGHQPECRNDGKSRTQCALRRPRHEGARRGPLSLDRRSTGTVGPGCRRTDWDRAKACLLAEAAVAAFFEDMHERPTAGEP